MNIFKKFGLAITLTLIISTFVFATGADDAAGGEQKKPEKLNFGDLSWESAHIHNRIAAFILQNGIGNYEIEYTAADTLVIINGIIQGDVNIDMESWHSNYREVYDKGIASGRLIDLGKIFLMHRRDGGYPAILLKARMPRLRICKV